MRLNKGAIPIEQIPTIALTFLFVAVVFGIGIYAMSQVTSNFPNTVVTNESITFTSNDTFYAFGRTPVTAVARVGNNTITLGAGNYTSTPEVIKLIRSVNIATGAYDVSYTSQANPEHRALQNATSGLGNISSYFPLIGVVFAAIIIIGLIAYALVSRQSV